MAWQVKHADCLDAMRDMDAASVDAVVCDPPYGLEFMGKDWDRFAPAVPTKRSGWDHAAAGESTSRDPDSPAGRSAIAFGKRRGTYRCVGCDKRDAFRNPHGCPAGTGWAHEWVDERPLEALAFQTWCAQWAVEALRVLKPGGHLLAFGGTRTYHRLASAIEDVGFEIRDEVLTLRWIYGQGFPKSHNVAKAIDRRAGADVSDVDDPEPVTEDAQKWDGWGTALKPAQEPIVVARKPLDGTVAENVLRHGTGAVNVAGCSIEVGSGDDEQAGRWPANLVIDEHAAAAVDAQSGHRAPGRFTTDQGEAGYDADDRGNVYDGSFRGATTKGALPIDAGGGASRFFYCVKASPAERNAGLKGEPLRYGELPPEAFDVQVAGGMKANTDGSLNGHIVRAQNVHPTVKPLDLMRWLCRLVTPPGGTVLDPFTGSGSTGCAAVMEDFDFIGIEREAEYVRIAEHRIAYWAAQPRQLELA